MIVFQVDFIKFAELKLSFYLLYEVLTKDKYLDFS